jgi:hypothetical protein
LSVLKLPLKRAVVSLYSVVKQQLKCNTSKGCNCLIEFLFTVVLSIEECIFLVEYMFYLLGAAKSAVYRDRPRMLNELKTATTAYIRNISQADLQKALGNKIKWIQTCIYACGHHFQHLL